MSAATPSHVSHPTAPFTLRSLRHAAIDLVAAAFALFAVGSRLDWAFYVMAGYTALMGVMKLGAYVAKVKPVRATDTPPDLLYHALYGAMVVAFVAGQWWGHAAAWGAIWGLSVLVSRR